MRDQGEQLQRLQNSMRAERGRSAALTAAKAQLRGEPKRDLLAFVGVSSHPSRGTLRAALRASWFPTGEELAALERDEGIVLRFVLGKAPMDPAIGSFTEQVRAHDCFSVPCAHARWRRAPERRVLCCPRTRNACLSCARRRCKRKLRRTTTSCSLTCVLCMHAHPCGGHAWLTTPRVSQHTEGPGDLSGKTLALLESASLQYDAVFVVKADDDVWLNLRELAASLRARRLSERLYMGCLRAGSPLRFTGTMYAHLAVGESLQFADPEPSVLPYAAGQIYVLSRELALHLAESSRLLRRFGNEDVSVGAWLVGLDADAVDEPRFCCEHCAEQTDDAPCIAIYQRECAGVCLPEATMERLDALCNASATPEDMGESKALLAEAAATRAAATAALSGGVV